jgi:hypothetical protein
LQLPPPHNFQNTYIQPAQAEDSMGPASLVGTVETKLCTLYFLNANMALKKACINIYMYGGFCTEIGDILQEQWVSVLIE